MNQKELDQKLQLHYVINRKKRDNIIANIPKENPTWKSFVEWIYSKSNEEILSDIKEKVDTLTPEFIKGSYYEDDDYYPTELYSDNSTERYTAQLKWLGKFGNDFEEIEQRLQIRRLFKKVGIDINVAQAEYIWEDVSDKSYASWLCREDDDATWWRILTDWVYYDVLLVFEGGKS